jgi:hypothetical protein
MRVLMAMVVGSMLFGCRPGGPHAVGSGYGVGVARKAFSPGKPMYRQGPSTGFLGGPKLEGTDYRPRQPHSWPPLATSRLPVKPERDLPK